MCQTLFWHLEFDNEQSRYISCPHGAYIFVRNKQTHKYIEINSKCYGEKQDKGIRSMCVYVGVSVQGMGVCCYFTEGGQ